MIKNLTFLLLALLSSFTLHAQTQKGGQLLGGTFSAEHNTSDTKYIDQVNQVNNNGKTNAFTIGPSYNYFVADNLGLAVNLGYSRAHNNDYSSTRNNDNITNGYFGSISLMKYFLYEKIIGVRTGPLAYYSNSKSVGTNTDPLYNSQVHAKGYGAGIQLDFVYFPVKRIGLIASIGGFNYSQYKIDTDYSNVKQSSLGISFLNLPSFSAYYAFGK
jgi:hypothetical protein